MAEFAHMPLATDSWIADTRHLTPAQRGTYLDLLILMWRTPGCRVPNDDGWLARHLSMTVEQIVAEVRPLIEEFCKCTGNWITDERVTKQWDFVQHKRKT